MIQLTGAGVVAGAAAAGSVNAANEDYPNTITFDGTASAGKSTYEFEVSGSVDPENGADTRESEDGIDGGSVTGAVHRDADVYYFSGALTYLDVAGEADVSISYGDEGDVAADRLEVVASSEADVEYSFTGTGRFAAVTDREQNPANDGQDSVTENDDGTWTVEGVTADGSGDTFDVWGEVTHFEPVEGAFTLFLNGEEVTVTDLTGQEVDDGEPDDEGNVLSIRSTADTPAMYYEFSVDGDVQKGDDAEDSDTVQQDGDLTTVNGQVGPRGEDSYTVPAKLEHWNAVDTDDADVDESRFGLYWNGEEVTLEEILVDGDDTEEEHVLSVRSTADTPAMYYEFTVGGDVQKGDDAEDSDTVQQDGGGVTTVNGQVGPRGEDSFVVPGKLEDWTAVDTDDAHVDESRFGLYWDDEETTLEEILVDGKPSRRLQVVTAEDAELEYSFSASDEITKVTDNGDNAADSTDEVGENGDGTWTADGSSEAGLGDTYDFKGAALDFQPREGSFALYLDGEQVTPWELVGEEEPEEPTTVDGGPMGGGLGYDRTVSPDEADVVVGTEGELDDALSSASSGDVVYVAGDAEIDVGSNTFDVPSGVTLASNRGIDDAPGGLVRTDEESNMFEVHSDARVTGVRIQGPFFEYFDPSWYATGTGMDIGDGVEVDNCEIWGFAYAGVNAESGEPHVHHNHVHHTPRDGLGYGVIGTGGHPLIEWNYFNYNRHAVASSGNGGYTVRYNRFGPDTIDIVLDVHRPGGTLTEIYNNTVEGFEEIPSGDIRPAFQMRGVPDDVAEIYNNWFYNPYEPRDSPTGGWTDEAIIQVHVDEWTNVEFWNNHYGQSEPSSDIGHPR